MGHTKPKEVGFCNKKFKSAVSETSVPGTEIKNQDQEIQEL